MVNKKCPIKLPGIYPLRWYLGQSVISLLLEKEHTDHRIGYSDLLICLNPPDRVCRLVKHDSNHLES